MGEKGETGETSEKVNEGEKTRDDRDTGQHRKRNGLEKSDQRCKG